MIAARPALLSLRFGLAAGFSASAFCFLNAIQRSRVASPIRFLAAALKLPFGQIAVQVSSKTDRLEQNKPSVTGFSDGMFNQCKSAEAVERYVGDACSQHIRGPGDGREHIVFRANVPANESGSGRSLQRA